MRGKGLYTLAPAGGPRAFQPIDVFERDYILLAMCRGESRGVQRGTDCCKRASEKEAKSESAIEL